MDYLDFDLSVEYQAVSPESCVVRVLNSPAGEAKTIVSLDRLQLWQSDAGDSTSDVRYGKQLFNSLMNGQVVELFRASEAIASEREQGLRLKIRTNHPQLDGVPWEMLYDPAKLAFLAQSRETPLVRYVEAPQVAEVLHVTLPLRVLGVAAVPAKAGPLAVEDEIRRIQEALKEPIAKGLIEVDWLKRPTRKTLPNALSRRGWHVLHFVGHGGAETASDDTGIYLEGADGSPDRLTLEQLVPWLRDGDCRFVLLNTCEGAVAGGVSGLASFAGGLVRSGVPAALGMRGRISDAAAIVLAEHFYAALAQGDPVDTALVEGRKALATSGTHGGPHVEWAMPVLFMRSPDGRLFAPSGETPLSPSTLVLESSVDRLHRLWMQHPWYTGLLVLACYLGVMGGAVALNIGSNFDSPCRSVVGPQCRANGFLSAWTWGRLLPPLLPFSAVVMSFYLRMLNTRFAQLDAIMRPLGSRIPFSEFLSQRVASDWPKLIAIVLALSFALTLIADAGYIFAPTNSPSLKFAWLDRWTEFDWSNAGHTRSGAPSRWWYFAFNVAAYTSQTFLIYCGLLMLVTTTYLFSMSIGKGLAATELVDIFGMRLTAQRVVGLFKIEWGFKHRRCGLEVLDQIFVTFHLLILVAMFAALHSVVYNANVLNGPDLGSKLLVAFTLLYIPLDVIWILYPYWSRFPHKLPDHLKGKRDYVEPSPWPFGSRAWTWGALLVVSATWITVAWHAVRALW